MWHQRCQTDWFQLCKQVGTERERSLDVILFCVIGHSYVAALLKLGRVWKVHILTTQGLSTWLQRWLADSFPASLAIPRMLVSLAKPIVNTLSKVVENKVRGESCDWLSVIPPQCEKCRVQARLPVSLKLCAETLACEHKSSWLKFSAQSSNFEHCSRITCTY